MSISVLDHLPELRPNSYIWLGSGMPELFKSRVHENSSDGPLKLVIPKLISSTNWASKPYKDSQSLLQEKNRQAIRKVMTLQPAFGGNSTYRLNTALLGGDSFPVLTALIGTVTGLGGLAAGLLFTAATTGVSASDRSQRVLARGGDEIWQVEEIGKVRGGSKYQAMHVNSYFLVDPFRKHGLAKGWLIHEERTEVILS